LLDSANILGMFMMGVLSSNLVSLTPKLKIGKFVLKNMLDGILPGLLPLLVVFGVYYLIKKKQVSTAKIVILLIAIGIAGSAIGLF
jgi:D-glucosaminate-specific PTS system IID component